MNKTKQHLIEARKLLETTTWVNHMPYQSNEHCALTALDAVKCGGRHSAYVLLRKVIMTDDNDQLSIYNDSHTKEEVLAAFDKAIELA